MCWMVQYSAVQVAAQGGGSITQQGSWQQQQPGAYLLTWTPLAPAAVGLALGLGCYSEMSYSSCPWGRAGLRAEGLGVMGGWGIRGQAAKKPPAPVFPPLRVTGAPSYTSPGQEGGAAALGA